MDYYYDPEQSVLFPEAICVRAFSLCELICNKNSSTPLEFCTSEYKVEYCDKYSEIGILY